MAWLALGLVCPMFASKKLCIELSCVEEAFDFCTGFGLRPLLDNLAFVRIW